MVLASSVGLGYFVQTSLLAPLTFACLVAALGFLALRAGKRRFYAPLCLGFVAVAIFLLGRYSLNHESLTYAGLGLLILASLWRSKPKGHGCEC